jgi:hypothetical protein
VCEPCPRAERYGQIVVAWIDAVAVEELLMSRYVSGGNVSFNDVETARLRMEDASEALFAVYTQVTGHTARQVHGQHPRRGADAVVTGWPAAQ